MLNKYFIIISVENSCPAKYFCENHGTIFQDSFDDLVNKISICNISNVFIVTFDQYNAYLLNKSILNLTSEQ